MLLGDSVRLNWITAVSTTSVITTPPKMVMASGATITRQTDWPEDLITVISRVACRLSRPATVPTRKVSGNVSISQRAADSTTAVSASA